MTITDTCTIKLFSVVTITVS